MQVRIFVEVSTGATYADQLRAAQASEAAGFDGFFRSDHYLAMSGDGGVGPTDAWLTLAGLARETRTLRLGPLMSSATFRTPATLAIGAAQVDQMSDGRLEVGLGAGWYQAEHTTYGIPLPPTRERLDHLDEQLAIITGLWQTPVGGRFNFGGKHYQMIDAPALPRPVQQPHPPIIIGGRGPRRTPALAARYADEFNVPFADVSLTEQQYGRVRAACAAAGRSQPPVFSACLAVFCGRTAAEARNRVQRQHGATALPPAAAVTGSPDEVVDQIGRYGEAGAQRVYLRVDVDDTDHIELLGSAVLPQLTNRS